MLPVFGHLGMTDGAKLHRGAFIRRDRRRRHGLNRWPARVDPRACSLGMNAVGSAGAGEILEPERPRLFMPWRTAPDVRCWVKPERLPDAPALCQSIVNRAYRKICRAHRRSDRVEAKRVELFALSAFDHWLTTRSRGFLFLGVIRPDAV